MRLLWKGMMFVISGNELRIAAAATPGDLATGNIADSDGESEGR